MGSEFSKEKNRPVTKVPVAPDKQTIQQVQSVAESVARQICANNSINLDLDCKVFGVTYKRGLQTESRAPFEEMTSSMVDRWRCCVSDKWLRVYHLVRT